tara:strand:+ start:599 stop:1405 length:807 start_codon:yes stop_codon:yes gene_type:complete
MKNINKISLVLPTLNEAENLVVLIPDIISTFENLKLIDYQIIVVDDNSTDGTKNLMLEKFLDNKKIEFYVRNSEKSLPMSIWEGIEKANFDYVMWLDADGSMSGDTIKKLIEKLNNHQNSVIVASRFVKGGGYKGTVLNEDNNFFRSMFNVQKSKDSVTATILSSVFNKLLTLISNSNVKDMTSGFIVGKKEYFNKTVFEISVYGEYFVYLMNYLNRKNIKVEEVGYVCGTRLHGVSKTGSSIMQLIKLGIPYIKAATISNRIDYENL